MRTVPSATAFIAIILLITVAGYFLAGKASPAKSVMQANMKPGMWRLTLEAEERSVGLDFKLPKSVVTSCLTSAKALDYLRTEDVAKLPGWKVDSFDDNGSEAHLKASSPIDGPFEKTILVSETAFTVVEHLTKYAKGRTTTLEITRLGSWISTCPTQ